MLASLLATCARALDSDDGDFSATAAFDIDGDATA